MQNTHHYQERKPGITLALQRVSTQPTQRKYKKPTYTIAHKNTHKLLQADADQLKAHEN
jgi:hypothetical protein